MNNNLDRIEAHLRALFEDKLLKVLNINHHSKSLIEDLIISMRDNLQTGDNTAIIAPDLFIIHVAPEDFLEWQTQLEILEQMAATLFTIGQDESFQFKHPPTISIHPDLALTKHDYTIFAQKSTETPTLSDTAVMEQPVSNQQQQNIPIEAFFIIGGITNFPLKDSVINIGRHSENDLILEDTHVSRHHAQLRVINDHYVIFDVGSTGGIYLNGKQISQATLHTGDVCRIGTVNLIYIQDTTSTNPTTVIPVENEDGLDEHPPGAIDR